MKVEYVEETSVRKALAFEIEADVVGQEIEARAREYARKVKLPGFRPGKIPTEVIKRRFRSQVLEDAAEAIVNRVVFEELEGRGLKPLASPKVTELKIDENEPMTFRAVFETLPFVELPEYKGVEVRVRPAAVADEEIDKEIERLRDDAARYDPVEGRPAQAGDFVLLDVWRLPAPGSPSSTPRHDENVLVEVGAADNQAELNAALAGMAVGDTREVRFEASAGDQGDDAPADAVTLKVALKAVKTKVVPSADDEFARDLDFDSLTALREDARKRLQAMADRRLDREAKNAVVARLVEQARFEVPEALIERHMNARTEGAIRDLALQGIDPSKTGVDWRRFREGQRDAAKKAATADLLIDEIARREGVEVLPAEVDAEIGRLAAGMRKAKEALRAQIEKEGDLSALRARIREEKVLDLLKADARLVFE